MELNCFIFHFRMLSRSLIAPGVLPQGTLGRPALRMTAFRWVTDLFFSFSLPINIYFAVLLWQPATHYNILFPFFLNVLFCSVSMFPSSLWARGTQISLCISELVCVFWLSSMTKLKRPHALAAWTEHHALAHTSAHTNRKSICTGSDIPANARTRADPHALGILGELKNL